MVAAFVAILVLAAGSGDHRPTSFDLTVAPHKYNLIRWEVTHFLDKWANKISDLMPWTDEPPREERLARAKEFFDLGTSLTELRRQDQGQGESLAVSISAEVLRGEIQAIQRRRDGMKAEVEETIESEISSILSQEGFSSRIGLIFPPVDTVFSNSPGVLILSPRDRIHRQESILMKPGLSDETREAIEDRIFEQEDLAALVQSTGGVAVFPSVVSESGNLHQAVVTVAHEWLHHWFFFQPLGQHFFDNSQMETLNETAATIAGEAIGDRVFTSMTGEPVVREPNGPREQALDDAGGAFNFDAAMRETRLRTEELLSQGRIQEAEAYMEERRRFMEDNGRYIRKINQAFFAFHGTYATSAASISPIDNQLRELESRSDSLGNFVKTVAAFGSHEEFREFIEGLGN